MLRRCGIRFHLHKFRPIQKYCSPFLVGTVMYLIAFNADRIVINQLISLEAPGICALALKFRIIISEWSANLSANPAALFASP